MDRYFGEYARALGCRARSSSGWAAAERDRRVLHDGAGAEVWRRYRNGVSKLHGDVSRQMWQSLWPGVPVDEVPIRHITNGVHFRRGCRWR